MVKNRPKWSHAFINETGVQRIESAVRAAEQRTSGEIVPVIIHHSASTALVPLVMGLFLVLMTIGLQQAVVSSDFLHQHWAWWVAIIASAVIGWFLGAHSTVQRWIVPRYEQERAAQRAALLEFYLANLNRTKGGTGILLFVSMQEHQAVVLADEGIAKHCRPEVFEEVVQDLIAGAKQGDLAGGFEKAIARSCDLLVPYFPRQKDDHNELTDHLIIREK